MENPYRETQNTKEKKSPIEAFREKREREKKEREKREREQLLAAEAVSRSDEVPVRRTYQEIRDAHPHVPENYERFRSEHQNVIYRRVVPGTTKRMETVAEKNVWDDQYIQEQYIRETDMLIGVVDGSITDRISGSIYDERIPEGESRVPDTILWLDKSARPVSWFFDAFYDDFAKPDVKKPDSEFLNIDRINWFLAIGKTEEDAASRLGPEDFDIDEVSDEKISAIRAYFTEGELTEENWQNEVWNLPTRLDGKHMLIVDEVKNRGGSLYIATELLKKAIPGLTVDGAYFWHTSRVSVDSTDVSSGSLQMATAPLWYNPTGDKVLEGRDVGDIAPHFHEKAYKENPNQETLRNKIASAVVSPPLHDLDTFEVKTDELAQKYRQDIAFMTYGLHEHQLVRIPSAHRTSEDVEEILRQQGLTRDDIRTITTNRDLKNKDRPVRM